MLAALGTVNTIHHLRAALLSRCGVHAALQRRIQYGGYHDSALAEWGGPAASTACSLPDGAHADRTQEVARAFVENKLETTGAAKKWLVRHFGTGSLF